MRRSAVPAALVTAVCLAAVAVAVTSPMPYRPGYGLGSWIPPEVIEGMKKEAYARSAISLSEQMDAAANSLAREIKIVANPLQNSQSSAQSIPAPLSHAESDQYVGRATQLRTSSWRSRVHAYDVLFEQMEEQMRELQAASRGSGEGDVSAFTTFASAAESPVVWEASEVALIARASDSFMTQSTVMKVDIVSQSMDESTSSTGWSASAGGGFSFFGPSVSTEVKRAAEDRYAAAKSTKNIEQTLILTSFATHRKVKQFRTLALDPDKLRKAWNFYKPNASIHDPALHTREFAREFAKESASGDTDDKISMVSEVFQGSTLVGFVHFLKKEQSSSNQHSSTARTETKTTMSYSMFISSLSGSTSFARSTAKKVAELASNAGLSIEFDLICQGFVPSIKSRMVQTTVSELKKTNVNDQSATDTGAKGQIERQDNTNSVSAGLLAAVNEVVSSNPVLGMETFMDAFDDFAKAAQQRPDEVGAPIGFNVKEFNRIDIMGKLAEKYMGNRNAAKKKDDKNAPPDAAELLRRQRGGGGGGGDEPRNPFDDI